MYKLVVTILIAVSLTLATPTVDAAQRHKPVQQKHLKVLPKGHQRVVHRGSPYYYSAGRFYRSTGGAYISIAAPIGAIVGSLPVGYVSFGIGSRRHFFFEGIFYRQVENDYEVIEEPPEAEQVLSQRVIAYPAEGQTQEVFDRDHYECYVWARDSSQFDPTDEYSDPELKGDYNRSFAACLEGRGYVVK